MEKGDPMVKGEKTGTWGEEVGEKELGGSLLKKIKSTPNQGKKQSQMGFFRTSIGETRSQGSGTVTHGISALILKIESVVTPPHFPLVKGDGTHSDDDFRFSACFSQ